MGGRIALVLGSVLFSLLMLELGARLWRGPATLLSWPNIVLEERKRTIQSGEGRLVHDKRLGFVAKPGLSKDGYVYDEHRNRIVPPPPPGVTLTEPPILVVGDSYAHGDEIMDPAAPWPSRLQTMLGRRVVNAAMSGYGLDQILIKAELSVVQERPAAMILSYIADDLRRSEMKRVWGAEKPYFDLVNGELVLRNTPVPLPPPPEATLDFWQWGFGWSVALDAFLQHKGWQYEWGIDHERIHPRGTGEVMACPIMKRLAKLGLPTLVVAEYDPYTWRDAEYRAEHRRRSQAVLRCAEQAGFATLDLFDTFDAAVKQHTYEKVFMTAHPSAFGASFSAQRIADELKARHIPP